MPRSKTTPRSSKREHAHLLLKQMLRIRRFEERAAEQYQAGKIRGFLHLYIGEEAIAAGAIGALEPDDAIVSTYREHGHALVRGLPPGALMAELYGKANGCSRGRGGSMHFFDVSRRFYGGYAIVGGGLPIAVGLALADKMRGERRATVCIFGEGAAAEGEFHESLNLAALWKLPILFLCENNYYAMGTALERSESDVDLCEKVGSYRVPAQSVDGMDVLAVEAATRSAVGAVRRGDGPQFIEFRTYRFRGHSMADPELYREASEVEEWKRRDPVATFVARLRRSRLLTTADLDRLEAEVAAEIEAAVGEAEAGPLEPVDDLLKFVMTEPA